MSDQRGALNKFIGALAAVVAAFALVAAPTPASASTSGAAPQIAADFPESLFYMRNIAQNKCVMPTLPSYTGWVTLQACGDVDQWFYTFAYDGRTHLVPYFGIIPDAKYKCLFDTGTKVYTNVCTYSAYTDWRLVGNTVKNVATGKCLTGNSAGEVYPATCDGTDSQNWEFPGLGDAANLKAGPAAETARRAEQADTLRASR